MDSLIQMAFSTGQRQELFHFELESYSLGPDPSFCLRIEMVVCYLWTIILPSSLERIQVDKSVSEVIDECRMQ